MLAALLGALLGAGSFAQEQAAEGDGRLLTTFGSWTLRCIPRENAAPCDIVQTLNDRETGAQVIAASLAHSSADATTAVQILAPLGVHLPKGLTLTAGGTTASGIRFTRCELQGCIVEGRLGEDVLAAMRGADALGLTFGVSAEEDVTIDVGLDGFAEAYDALIAETAARTTTAQ